MQIIWMRQGLVLAAVGCLALADQVTAQSVGLGNENGMPIITFGHRSLVPVTIHHPAGIQIALEGKKVAFGQISGPCAQEFSDGLISAFQANGITIVDRGHVNAVLAEHQFQMSSSVDPTTAVELGRILGASVMVFVNVSDCRAVRKPPVRERQFVGPPVIRSRTQAHFLASINAVDLRRGSTLAARSIKTDPYEDRRLKGLTAVPEYADPNEVREKAVRMAIAEAAHLFFPWTETRQVRFMDSKHCNLRQAYNLLKAGDNEGALKQSQDNVEACKSEKLKRQADAWYNLGVAYYSLGDDSNALRAMSRANRLHSDRAVLEAINAIRQDEASEKAIGRAQAQQSAEAKQARSRQQQLAQKQAQATLTNASIIKMVKGGLSAGVITRMIASDPGRFSVTPDALVALKSAGVPDSVIAAILDKK